MSSDKLQRIFKKIEDLNPIEGLETLILKKIELEKEKQVRGKLFLSYFGLAGSLAAAMYAIVVFGDGFLKSEFWSMVSLIFSDAFIVAGNWQEYAYSLLETFPVTHLIAILIPVFTLLLSFNLYLSNRKNNHSHLSFHKLILS